MCGFTSRLKNASASSALRSDYAARIAFLIGAGSFIVAARASCDGSAAKTVRSP